MPALLSHTIGSDHFVLSSERTLFWENEQTLIVADLHIGKTGHFRKSGIAVPQSVYKEDLQRLMTQILFFKADKLIIVGDLSHSHANRELDLFLRWRRDFSSLDIKLARGNHDILDAQWYAEAAIEVHEKPLQIGSHQFIHDVLEPGIVLAEGLHTFSGHVHPAVSIRGKGKQALRFPCFYFTDNYCILPAFSRFTGSYTVEPGKNDHAYALVEKDIILLGKK